MAYNFNQLLGEETPEEKRSADYAKGARTGVIAVKLIMEALALEHQDESDAFFEGLFDAIRTEI